MLRVISTCRIWFNFDPIQVHLLLKHLILVDRVAAPSGPSIKKRAGSSARGSRRSRSIGAVATARAGLIGEGEREIGLKRLEGGETEVQKTTFTKSLEKIHVRSGEVVMSTSLTYVWKE